MESAPPEALQAALAGRYRLERMLGAGGMATVYVAHDLAHDREVALKVLRPELGSVLGAERFLAEIKLTARLSHPHIVTVLDSGQAAGFLYYVLPLIRGQSLRDRMHHEGRLGVAEVARIIGQVAGALDYAHRQGIVHRDIKPENILLHEGEAMLSDFGIALAVSEAGGTRLTSSGISLGTPLYMSPEQASGSTGIGPASDQFSLAAMAYEMLSGETPHAGATTHAIMARLLTETPTRLRVLRADLPAGVDDAVAKALAKTPGDRYPNCGAFAAALQAGSVTSDAMPTLRYANATVAIPKRPRRRWIIAAAVPLLGLAAWAVTRLRQTPTTIAGEVVQVTTTGHASVPTTSPDGSLIAYVDSRCDEDDQCVDAIVLREAGGEEARTLVGDLTGPYPYQWSADGRWLLFAGSGPHLKLASYVVSRLGGPPIQVGEGIANFLASSDTILTATPDPVPYGRPTMVYLSPSPGQPVVDSVPLRAPRKGLLLGAIRAEDRGRLWAVAWFDEVRSEGVLSIHRRDGAFVDSVTAIRAGSFRWSPDGTALYLPPDKPRDVAPILIRFALASGRFGRVDTLHLPLGSTTPLTQDLSTDGRVMVYQSSRFGESTLRTYERGPNGLRSRARLLATSSHSVFGYATPDGRRVVILNVSGVGDSAQYRWSVAGWNDPTPRALTPPIPDHYASTTDDRGLYLVRFRHDTERSWIERYDLQSGAMRRVASGLPAVQAIEADAEGGVVVATVPGDTITAYGPDGRARWRIGIPDSIGQVRAMTASPDHRAFLLIIQPTSTALGADGNTSVPVLTVDAATGTVRHLADIRVLNFLPMAWGTDGAIHFNVARAGEATGRHLRVRVSDGRVSLAEPMPFGNCNYSDDLTRTVCFHTERLNDIYLFRARSPLP